MELHADEIPDNEMLIILNSTSKVTGKLSVRISPGNIPLLLFEHEECIFCQFFFVQGIIPVIN